VLAGIGICLLVPVSAGFGLTIPLPDIVERVAGSLLSGRQLLAFDTEDEGGEQRRGAIELTEAEDRAANHLTGADAAAHDGTAGETVRHPPPQRSGGSGGSTEGKHEAQPVEADDPGTGEETAPTSEAGHVTDPATQSADGDQPAGGRANGGPGDDGPGVSEGGGRSDDTGSQGSAGGRGEDPGGQGPGSGESAEPGGEDSEGSPGEDPGNQGSGDVESADQGDEGPGGGHTDDSESHGHHGDGGGDGADDEDIGSAPGAGGSEQGGGRAGGGHRDEGGDEP
jgi:hypothetical protein